MAKANEEGYAWDTNMQVREVYRSCITLAHEALSAKKAISIWEAKTILEKLHVQADHIVLKIMPLNEQNGIHLEALFFTYEKEKKAKEIIEGVPKGTIFWHGVPMKIAIQEEERIMPEERLVETRDHTTILVKGLPAKWFDVNTRTTEDMMNRGTLGTSSDKLQQLFSKFGRIR